MLQQVGKAEVLVDKMHCAPTPSDSGHLDQALPVNLALLKLDLRMGGAHDQIDSLGTGGDDPRHGLNHVFQPLAAIDQSESAYHLPAGEVPAVLVRAVAMVRDLRHSMRNHPHLRP